MSLVRIIGLLLGAFGFCFGANASAGKNYLFDMGKKMSPVGKGYTAVTSASIYSARQGFGWIKPPETDFDTLYNRIADSLFRDGVVGRGELVFRVDVLPGEYWVTLTVGFPAGSATDIDFQHAGATEMQVTFNEKTMIGRTATPWYRLPYRSMRKKVMVENGRAIFQISGQGKVGLYSLELRADGAACLLTFSATPDIEPDELDNLKAVLRARKARQPSNAALANVSDMVDKLSKANWFYELAGWSESVKKTRMNQIQRMYAAIDLLDQLVADSKGPVYYQALFLLGKIHFWLTKEDRQLLKESRTGEIFAELGRAFPEHEIIQMYQGKQIADPYTPIGDVSQAPEWAILQQEAMARMCKVIRWWVKERQEVNGELGGKYGDDVEMLRWWLPAILGADDATAREGYTRMADGLWNSGELVGGYDRKLDDVEHAAELFRDSHTGMFMVRYGDPAYVERAMISMQNFEKVWSGITRHGHRHFRSYYFSATETLPHAPFGVDVPLNARALLPGLWTAWYNRNPTLLRLFSQWADAWVADAARTDGGKPEGLVPAAVAFENERLGGFSGSWYNPGLRYDYYNWDHFSHVGELYSFLTGLHSLSGKASYIKPLTSVAEMMSEAPTTDKNAAKGGLPWVKQVLQTGGADQIPGANPFGDLFAMASRLTGDSAYNGLIKTHASVYNRYQLTGDASEILTGFDRILNGLRYNFPLLTCEAKFTDRVYVPGSDLLTGMYTGHFGRGFEFPALVASWKNTGSEVSVFVRKGDTRSALVSVYNAGKAKRIGMNTWMLQAGTYEIVIGMDRNDDLVAEQIIHQAHVGIQERVGRFEIDLPAAGEVIIKIDLVESHEDLAQTLPDLALAERDIRVEKVDGTNRKKVYATVHNIGGVASETAQAFLWIDGKLADSCALQSVEAPVDLVPRSREIVFNYHALKAEEQISVQLKTVGKELNSTNNTASIRYSYTQTKPVNP